MSKDKKRWKCSFCDKTHVEGKPCDMAIAMHNQRVRKMLNLGPFTIPAPGSKKERDLKSMLWKFR